MGKILTISPDKCMGCRTCEIICSFQHTEEFNPHNSAVSVIAYEEAAVTVPLMCMHCEDAACMKVCPVKAISKGPSGVFLDKNKCIGCKLCVSACPLGAMTVSTKDQSIIKCDLCGGKVQCAAFCPVGAIEYVEPTEGYAQRKKIIAEKFKELFGEVK